MIRSTGALRSIWTILKLIQAIKTKQNDTWPWGVRVAIVQLLKRPSRKDIVGKTQKGHSKTPSQRNKNE